MALTHVLLFFHFLGAVSFFAGAAVAGTLQLAAMRRDRPSEVHAFLRLAPGGVALVGLERLGNLARNETEDFLEIERGVDGRDRLGQQT